MKCADSKNLLSEYIDGALDENNRLIVSDHLKTCKNCSDELDLLKQTISLLKSRKPVEPPSDFVFQVRKKIEERQWWKEVFKLIFYPFHIKIPLEAIATIAIVCVLYSVYYEKETVQQPKSIPEEAIITAPKVEAPSKEIKMGPQISQDAYKGTKEFISQTEAKKDISLKDSYGKEIPSYPEMERRSAIQRSIMEKEEISYKKAPDIKMAGQITEKRKKSYKAEPALGYSFEDSASDSPAILASRVNITEEAEVAKPTIVYPELILTLTNPRKDILKIKIYIYTIEGKIIKEIPLEMIKISLPLNKYPKLLKMLEREGFLKEFHDPPEQPIEKYIVILLKIKK